MKNPLHLLGDCLYTFTTLISNKIEPTNRKNCGIILLTRLSVNSYHITICDRGVEMSSIPNERCREIIEILINREDPIIIDEIAHRLNVSNKTVRNDLKTIDEFLNNKGIGNVVKKPRVGVWIEIEPEGKCFLDDVLDTNTLYIQPFSVEKRRLYIAKRLLKANGFITTRQLAEELYISRVTIHKDLKEIEEILSKYDLKLARKKGLGIAIKGNEISYRKAMSDLLKTLNNSIQELGVDSDIKALHFDSRITYESQTLLKELLPNIDITLIEDILNEAESKMFFIFTDESFNSLAIHIAISLNRITTNMSVQMENSVLDNLKKHNKYDLSRWICRRLEDVLSISIPENEVAYISTHVIGSKIRQRLNEDKDKVLSNIEPEIIALTREIIALAGNILSVDFSNDEKLLLGLSLHLQPTIYRLKYGHSIRNPLLEDIKKNYPNVFGASWATSILFEKHFNVKVNEEEIGYIAIHLGAALERNKNSIKALIVCGSGIGTAHLVAIRLKKAFNDIEIVDITNIQEYKNKDKKTYDFVITTVPIQESTKPVVKVKALVSERDIDEIKKIMKKIEASKASNKK